MIETEGQRKGEGERKSKERKGRRQQERSLEGLVKRRGM